MKVFRFACMLCLTMSLGFGGVAAATAAPSASAIATRTAFAPPNEPASAATFDAAARRDIVAKLSEALRQRYIFPEVGERAAARIDSALAAGEYDALTGRSAFIARLDADVRAIANDKHLNIF